MSTSSEENKKTLNEKEVLFFKELSDSWWNENGPLYSLHAVNKSMALHISNELIKSGLVDNEIAKTTMPLQALKVLEVGCGGGILTERLAELGCTLVAIDVTPELVAVAKEHAKSDPLLSKITYMHEAVEEHAIHNFEKYDVVICNFVLEHVDDHDLLINACVKCLRPGGITFMSAVSKTFWSWLTVIYFAENIFRCAPSGLHDWNKCINAEDTQRILESYSCKIIKTNGLFFNLFTSKPIWWPILSFFYVMHAVKIV